MDGLPDHKILKFHPDTFQYVRMEHGLDKPGQMDAAIELLDDWVKKQAHFTKKDLPRDYLERTIIFDKGSVERAKKQLDRLFTMRTSMPHFFDRTDAKADFENLHDYYVDALLPKLTEDHYRIYAGKILKDGITTKILNHSYRFATLIFEHIRANDYCAGFVAILDYRNINIIDFVAQINLIEMHQIMLFVMEGYQMRLKGIHLLTTSKAIEIMVRLFKQVLSKKIGDRIRVHMTLESLHECVPKDLLPEEFGGELKSLVDFNNDWVEVFASKEHIEQYKEMNNARVNENLRNGSTKLNGNGDLYGTMGSFRTLNVD